MRNFDDHFSKVQRDIERGHRSVRVIGTVIMCFWLAVLVGVVFAAIKVAPVLMRILEKVAS
jgi:hypothetical protein